MGSYIQEDSVDTWIKAFQFKVEKIYHGKIVTPASPLYTGQIYENTDSTVWLLTGPEETCFRWLYKDKAIFAVKYNEGFSNPDDAVGYIPTICRNDYFRVSMESVTGKILSPAENITLSLSDFEKTILSFCGSTSTDNLISASDETQIFPQPAIDLINIHLPNDKKDWDITLFDSMGKEILRVQELTVELIGIESGIYFLLFTNGHSRFTKRFIKL